MIFGSLVSVLSFAASTDVFHFSIARTSFLKSFIITSYILFEEFLSLIVYPAFAFKIAITMMYLVFFSTCRILWESLPFLITLFQTTREVVGHSVWEFMPFVGFCQTGMYPEEGSLKSCHMKNWKELRMFILGQRRLHWRHDCYVQIQKGWCTQRELIYCRWWWWEGGRGQHDWRTEASERWSFNVLVVVVICLVFGDPWMKACAYPQARYKMQINSFN